jgi:cold shock CspA family protein
MRLRGRVRRYNEQGGFGFIVSSSGGDFFVHHRAVVACLGPGFRLQKGDLVEFSLQDTDSGRPAVANIQLILEST